RDSGFQGASLEAGRGAGLRHDRGGSGGRDSRRRRTVKRRSTLRRSTPGRGAPGRQASRRRHPWRAVGIGVLLLIVLLSIVAYLPAGSLTAAVPAARYGPTD